VARLIPRAAGRGVRERVARVLIALAMRIAPSSRDAFREPFSAHG
jgi:hypothetical protein